MSAVSDQSPWAKQRRRARLLRKSAHLRRARAAYGCTIHEFLTGQAAINAIEAAPASYPGDPDA